MTTGSAASALAFYNEWQDPNGEPRPHYVGLGETLDSVGMEALAPRWSHAQRRVDHHAGYLEHKSPTMLDYPDIQVIFANIVDPVGPLGAKGLGEVPTVGVAPAIANAIHNATGIRLRRTPFP